jgi:hypothetical protein
MSRARKLAAAPVTSAQGAPNAPVPRPDRHPAIPGPEPRAARHTGPQGAAVGDVARAPASRIAHVSANALDPELITGIERLAELASLLATGFLRHRLRKASLRADSHRRAADGAENGLAILRASSDSCVKLKSGGETR